MIKNRIILFLAALTAVRLLQADDTTPTKDLIATATRSDIAAQLSILCNPAIASPGLQLMTAEDLKRYWRSDHYGELSNNILSRPAIVIDARQ